jgi:DNA-directed RNA polymerase subunit K/omega
MSDGPFFDVDLLFETLGELHEPRVRSVEEEETGMPFAGRGLHLGGRAQLWPSDRRDLGKRLYEAAFSGRAREVFERARALAAEQGRQLRLRLHLSNELAGLPWEYLYDATGQSFLSLEGPVVRILDLPMPHRERLSGSPLRVLAVLPSGEDQGVAEALGDALDGLVRDGQVVLDWLPLQGRSALQERLSQGDYDVVHLTGRLDRLALKTAELTPKSVLAVLQTEHKPAGAAMSETAESLIRRGFTSVVTSPLPAGRGAARFANRFYRSLAAGSAVELAVAEGRRTLHSQPGEELDWGAPVVYTRAAGVAFDGVLVQPSPVKEPEFLDHGLGAASEAAPAAAPSPVTTAAASTQSEPDLPRSFYALAQAPSDVVMGEKFILTAGTTKDPPTPDAQPLERPASSVGEYVIVLTLQAVGFTIVGDHTTFDLRVTHGTPYPTVDIGMTSDPQKDDKVERKVTLFYAIDGQVIGSMERKIVVHIEENNETRAAQRDVWWRIFSVPTHDVPPDLTVMVTDDGKGELAWSFITPHRTVVVPRGPVHKPVGDQTKEFAKGLVNQINSREGKAGLYEFIVGIGKQITGRMPPSLWAVLETVARAANSKTLSLLVISNEPYIPWELAAMPTPLDAKLPPFLGVQTCMGRWIIGDRLPPPRAIAPQHAAVISGRYTKPGWPNLENALEEAEIIRAKYGATDVEATTENILAVFGADPAPDLLHFSMHGQWADDGVQNGLITIEGGAIAPQMVTGAIAIAARTEAPFVFLNACQVAGGTRILGDYGGLAAAFVNGGATAVIAPLWSINDRLAKEIAVEFYEATLGRGDLPAEVIRRAREAFTKSQSGTYLAYVFFGHPSLRLDGSRLKRKE